VISATGRGSYQRTRLNRHGFLRGYLMRRKFARGFRTGYHVCAVVPSWRKAGPYTGRVAVSRQRLIQYPETRNDRAGHRAQTLRGAATGRWI